MALRFGTSGVRGLVTEMTDRECYLYASAFLVTVREVSETSRFSLAGDLRSSTPRILRAVALAARDAGFELEYCGLVPTPALGFRCLTHGTAGAMVTGSHIPDDRNGIKFYLPWGETLKSDEAAISTHCERLRREDANASGFDSTGAAVELPELPPPCPAVARDYVHRYLEFFPENSLSGLRVVVYEHSAVGRDLLTEVLERLGANVVPVGRSDRFVAVDTEAVEEPDTLAAWVREHGADALVSTDGDTDRPLVVAEDGRVIRGDVLGVLVADFLGADCVATPVSCNTVVERCGRFDTVTRTRIGSPYVIAAMREASEPGGHCVVGYEANGGFLTDSEINLDGFRGALAALPTRDALLPILAVLHRRASAGNPISALLDDLPPRVTRSDLLRPFPTETGQALIRLMVNNPVDFAEKHLRDTFGAIEKADTTDGARFTFSDGSIVHFRPSGNAPEFRCYTEADTDPQAAELNRNALQLLDSTLRRLVD